MSDIQRDLTRTTLAIVCVLGLIGMSLWVLRPFLAALVWATMIVVATWPLFLALEKRLRQRRGLAVGLMALAMLLVLVAPFGLAIDLISDHAEALTALALRLTENGLPQPPNWVATLPLIGAKLAASWAQLADAGSPGLLAKVNPYAAGIGKWVLAQVGSLGGLLIQCLLVVVIAAILFNSGEAAAQLVRRFGRRLAGERGENAVILAGQAIRDVALGIGVTAIVQTTLGAFGLLVAGIPFASLLAALMLVLSIAQIGPAPVLLPTVAWMYVSGESGAATAFLVWSLLVGGIDGILRPILIRRGADLPLLLIFAGVIGGMLSFGLIGIFVGPVVLAVTYTLMQAWVADALGQAD